MMTRDLPSMEVSAVAHEKAWCLQASPMRIAEHSDPEVILGEISINLPQARLWTASVFKDEIQQKLKDISIFVAVVSPSYLESEFSIIHKLEWFQNRGGKETIQLLKVPLDRQTSAGRWPRKVYPSG
jgi:hypothetical protein